MNDSDVEENLTKDFEEFNPIDKQALNNSVVGE